MYKLIFSILFFSILGCQETKLEHKKIVYEKMYMNSPYSITFLYKTDMENVLVSETVHSYDQKVEFIVQGTEKIVEFDRKFCSNDPEFNIKVYLPSLDNIEAGELNKGKFGTDKLHEIK